MNNEHDVHDKGNQISKRTQRSYKIINNNYTSLYIIWINECVKWNSCCGHVYE